MTVADAAASATPTAGLDVGGRVRYWRRRRGKTQQVLADFAGLSREYIRKIEQGRCKVQKSSTLAALAEALQVPVDELAPELTLTSAGTPRALARERAATSMPAVTRLGDVEVVLAPGRVGDGIGPSVVVIGSRTRRSLLRLTPQAAASLCLLIQARAAAARQARRPVVEPSRRHS
jgi:transcriptional regulator with XRE-family HTH domain